MKHAITIEQFKQRILVKPYSDLLTDDKEEVALDYVGRYEDLQQSFDTISERLHLPSTDLTKKNASEHDAYTKYYDDELREKVGRFYEKDLRTFGYDFEPSPPIN